MIDIFTRLCGTGQAVTDTNPGAVSTDWIDMDKDATGAKRIFGGGQLVVARFAVTVAVTAGGDPDNTVQLDLVRVPKTLATPTTARTLAAFDNTTDVAGTVITSTAHGLTNGTRITVAQTSGTLNTGTGYAVATWLYIVNATTNTFGVSATPGGAAISLTDQTGTTTVTWYPEIVVSSGPIPFHFLPAGAVVELAIPPHLITPAPTKAIHRYMYAMFSGPTDIGAGTFTCDIVGGYAQQGQPFNKVNYVTA